MELLGERLRYYRLKKGLTIRELAEGICNESTVFRLEKSKQLPRLEILKDLSEKLDVPLHVMLFSYDKDIHRLKKLCRELTYFEDYLALEIALEELKKVNDTLNDLYSQNDTVKFIKWHESIIFHKFHKDNDRAITLLRSLLESDITFNENDLGILNSMGLIYIDSGEYELSLQYFEKAFSKLDDALVIDDLTLKPRIKYNYAFVLYYLDKKDHALQVGFELLYYLKSNHLNYLLGEILHMIGSIYKSQKNSDEALIYFEKALSAFILEDNFESIEVTKKSILDLKNNN